MSYVKFKSGNGLNILPYNALKGAYSTVYPYKACFLGFPKDGTGAIYPFKETDMNGNEWDIHTEGTTLYIKTPFFTKNYTLPPVNNPPLDGGYLTCVFIEEAQNINLCYLAVYCCYFRNTNYPTSPNTYFEGKNATTDIAFLSAFNAIDIYPKTQILNVFSRSHINNNIWSFISKKSLGLETFSKSVLNLQDGDFEPIIPPDNLDPNAGGGTSSPSTDPQGGTGGTFDLSSDKIDFPSLPSLSAVDAGFLTLYSPTLSQVRSLASYMWSGDIVEAIKKIFANPIDAILGLSIVPCGVPTAGSKEIKVGNISTGVSANVASSQYLTLDCGTLNPKEYWASALDYSPFTKFSIFLPYIGFQTLSPDDCMQKELHIIYNIDILSGACVANIKCGESILYAFSGALSTQIPITSADFTSAIASNIGFLGTGAGLLAGVATGVIGSAGVAVGGAVALATAGVNNVLAQKPNIQHGGSIGGSSGFLGVQKPYLIWELPRQSVPLNRNVFQGYPSNVTSKLGDLKGYTEVGSIHLENIPCTSAELAEIESLLKRGVII